MGTVFVVMDGRDVLRDRGAEYGNMLREMGKIAEVVEIEGQQHGFFSMSSRFGGDR